MPQDQRGWRRSSRDDWEDERDYGRGRESWRGESRSFRSRYEDDQFGGDHDRRQDRDYQGTLRAGDYGRYEEEEGRSYPERFQGGGRFGLEDRSRDYGAERYGGYGGQNYGGSYGGEYGGRGDYGSRDYSSDVNAGRSRRYGGSGGSYGYSGNYPSYGQSDYSGGFGTYSRDYERNYGGGEYRDRNYREREYRGRESRPYGSRERDWWDRATDEVSSWFGDEDAERRRRMDRHRGRGPKNYTRSDDRIREDVSDRLTEDPLIDASDIDVSVSDQEVTLSGTVASRNERRLAEEVAEQASGVKYVQNNLRVKIPVRSSGVSGTSGTFGSGSSSTSM